MNKGRMRMTRRARNMYFTVARPGQAGYHSVQQIRTQRATRNPVAAGILQRDHRKSFQYRCPGAPFGESSAPRLRNHTAAFDHAGSRWQTTAAAAVFGT